MSSELMRKTATVLEKLAEYLDKTYSDEQNNMRQERLKVAADLNQKLNHFLGDSLSEQEMERVAESTEAMQLLEKIASRITLKQGAPDSLGESAGVEDQNTAITSREERTKTASSDADVRFLNWIMD